VPSPASPLADLLADLARVLAARRVRWYLFGAQAAILHGAARLTADVDVTIDAGDQPRTDIVRALAAAGFELRVRDAEGFVERTSVLPLVHAPSRIPVDLVIAGPGLEELFLGRVERRTIGGIEIPVVGAEDLVAMKVLAGRSKDLEDAAAVIRARGRTLDLELVRTTLRLLEQALDRGDLLPELERVRTRAARP
jgi:hypothetical protein